jgi:hypothetical protein
MFMNCLNEFGYENIKEIPLIPECNGLRLDAFLILPVQRILRYKMLLEVEPILYPSLKTELLTYISTNEILNI